MADVKFIKTDVTSPNSTYQREGTGNIEFDSNNKQIMVDGEVYSVTPVTYNFTLDKITFRKLYDSESDDNSVKRVEWMSDLIEDGSENHESLHNKILDQLKSGIPVIANITLVNRSEHDYVEEVPHYQCKPTLLKLDVDGNIVANTKIFWIDYDYTRIEYQITDRLEGLNFEQFRILLGNTFFSGMFDFHKSLDPYTLETLHKLSEAPIGYKLISYVNKYFINDPQSTFNQLEQYGLMNVEIFNSDVQNMRYETGELNFELSKGVFQTKWYQDESVDEVIVPILEDEEAPLEIIVNGKSIPSEGFPIAKYLLYCIQNNIKINLQWTNEEKLHYCKPLSLKSNPGSSIGWCTYDCGGQLLRLIVDAELLYNSGIVLEFNTPDLYLSQEDFGWTLRYQRLIGFRASIEYELLQSWHMNRNIDEFIIHVSEPTDSSFKMNFHNIDIPVHYCSVNSSSAFIGNFSTVVRQGTANNYKDYLLNIAVAITPDGNTVMTTEHELN